MKRRSKWGNVPTVVDGIRFASKAEAGRYCELKVLVKSGEILNLCRQPKFPITADGKKVATYIADFAYNERGKFGLVIEDVKGKETDTFRLKWKIVKALYPDNDWRLVPAKSVRTPATGGTRSAA